MMKKLVRSWLCGEFSCGCVTKRGGWELFQRSNSSALVTTDLNRAVCLAAFSGDFEGLHWQTTTGRNCAVLWLQFVLPRSFMLRLVTIAGRVMLGAGGLLLTGCAYRDYRDEGRYYEQPHRAYYERVDYRYGGDRYYDR